MTIAELLTSLTETERNYIAQRDYGQDMQKHRAALDIVIEHGGAVDLKTQYWFPYEVIELCKNQLEEGHEREFAACVAIVLKNILDGRDKCNDVDWLFENVVPEIKRLPTELQLLLNGLFDQSIKEA
jgi:hypothetical protein